MRKPAICAKCGEAIPTGAPKMRLKVQDVRTVARAGRAVTERWTMRLSRTYCAQCADVVAAAVEEAVS